MVGFGVQNALLDLGSFRMPSLIPMTVYTAIVPMSGCLIALFTVEQIVNGLKNGYAGPEDAEFGGEPVE
jgi:TRAP-type C4-dicarboxylate transport system permease small subunit